MSLNKKICQVVECDNASFTIVELGYSMEGAENQQTSTGRQNKFQDQEKIGNSQSDVIVISSDEESDEEQVNPTDTLELELKEAPVETIRAKPLKQYQLPKTFLCTICNIRFFQLKQLQEHQKAHTKVQCKFCGLFVTLESYKTHLKSHSKKKKQRTLSCPYCDRLYFYVLSLERHIQLCHKDKDVKFMCKFCFAVFTNGEELLNHIQLIHGEQTNQTYQCTLCGISFNTEDEKKFHLEAHNKTKKD